MIKRLARPALLLVLLIHGLLWLLLTQGNSSAPAHKTERQLISLRLQPLARPAARPQPPAVAPRPISITQPRAAARAMPDTISAQPPAVNIPPEALAASPSATPPASAPLPSLLDSEATRRAVRQAALSAPEAAQAKSLPETTQQRLGHDIARSADGDCLKGEFAGGGMGLLSAPFWLLAEARGKCRR
ncbi:hypothetical protein OOZ63_04305 [Paucibacter sp. PLA-PC-4]|uniref:hypothetical protein n=1 Tax=Paucibacter sp. PLA-PC-4 TaxID=2993655 RepID=UPI0022496B9E|nr:hypothetical protein [Paucibacter sp. PLA-PC-4]MCX2861057.1 hypothetical protein [Paucibacter sp. PLA-PC-4]